MSRNMTATQGTFHVVTIGWGASLIEGMLDRIGDRTGVRFSHLIVSPRQMADFGPREGRGRLYPLRECSKVPMPDPDMGLLVSLEGEGVPTIRNMILADRVVRTLPLEDALGYATFLARRLTQQFRELRPTLVIGGFDSLHAGIGLAVARKLGIPWYAMYFTTLPQRLCGFCHGLTPDAVAPIEDSSGTDMNALAVETIQEFRSRRIVVTAYESPSGVFALLRRLPLHMRIAVRAFGRMVSGRYDRFTEYPMGRLLLEYLRRRRNLLLLPKRALLMEPPSDPYVLFGLHMQPESAIDTWAPFYTNQFNVVELLARALPPTHRLLVKIHKSDADNYSPAQLKVFLSVPGVDLVHPLAQSRDFIESAAAIVGIQGTMAVEAALLGKPVLMFGDSPMHRIPGVTRVGAHRDLPCQVRHMLNHRPPGLAELERGFAEYLGLYGPGCYYDWERALDEEQIDNLSRRLLELCEYSRPRSGGTGEGPGRESS